MMSMPNFSKQNIQNFSKASKQKCETICKNLLLFYEACEIFQVLCLDRGTLFKAMGAVPALEDRLWRRVSTCVALNIIAKQTGAMVNNDQ